MLTDSLFSNLIVTYVHSSLYLSSLHAKWSLASYNKDVDVHTLYPH